MKIQESAENYLETILILKEKKGVVRSIDIVHYMNSENALHKIYSMFHRQILQKQCKILFFTDICQYFFLRRMRNHQKMHSF